MQHAGWFGARIRDVRLLSLVGLYFARLEGRRVLPRSELLPADLAPIMPFAFLYDFDAGSRDFTLRLAGEEIRQMLPGARRGASLRDVMPGDSYDVVRERYLNVACRPAVLVAVGQVFIRLNRPVSGERLVLPLSDDGGNVFQVLGATIYDFSHDTPPESRRFDGEKVTVEYLDL